MLIDRNNAGERLLDLARLRGDGGELITLKGGDGAFRGLQIQAGVTGHLLHLGTIEEAEDRLALGIRRRDVLLDGGVER
jgi:hypothetical protein